MSCVLVRQAAVTDRARIVEISSQIWDGDDYVPEVLDAWFADAEGELVVATLDGHVIAFAHRSWLCPKVAWFEGIRADAAFRGHGAGKAITEYLIASARDAGAVRIDLSTYIDNAASIHIIESHGFRRQATFCYIERAANTERAAVVADASALREMPLREAIAFADRSTFLSLSKRRFPQGWRLFPFDQDPEAALAPYTHRLGHGKDGAWRAMLCLIEPPDPAQAVVLGFLDGDADGMSILLDHVLARYPGRAMESMIPDDRGRRAAALPLLQAAGFTSWTNFTADVFVYTLDL
jgi:GNAT superfamily N-acetyltransferase